MKSQDIVLQLASRLPQLVEGLTDNVEIVSMVRTGTTMLVTTSSVHGFVEGQGVNISGSLSPLVISSITRSGSVGLITTGSDHDMTLRVPGFVDVTGATEPEFNGTFKVTGVFNRRTLQFSIEDSGPTVATGTPLLVNGGSVLQQFNGLYPISATPSTTTFEYEVLDNGLLDPVGDSIVARSNARISSAISLERILDSYTEQSINQLWLFVVLGNTSASKNRSILSDATDNVQRSQHYRQQLLQPISLYLVIPSSQEISGSDARDQSEELFRPICQSILFEKFDTQLYSGKSNPLHFLSHGFAVYNRSYYVHEYIFEQVADLQFEDTVGYSEDVAFRDIFLDQGLDVGTARLTAKINLDEEPLP